MATQDEGLTKAIDFQIDALILMGASGRSMDLRLVMRELNIFEDLFSNTMSGTLLINDTQNMINRLGLIGAEHLIVQLSKPTMPLKLSKAFRVYKITDRRRGGALDEDYLIHFCSEELVLDASIKVSKSYKGRSVSQMVTDVARTYLGIDSAKLPLSAITTTSQSFDVVIPLWTPLYTINWLSRLATTGQDKGHSFVFFEDSQGFHFQSLESLSQQAPVQELNYAPATFQGEKNKTKSDMQQRFETIESYEICQGPDILGSIPKGMYASKLITVNTMNHSVSSMTMDATALFKTTKHLGTYSIFSAAKDRTGNKQTEHYESYVRVKHDSLDVKNWALQRNAYLTALHAFRIKVVVPGHMGLRVGQVIQLNLPAATKADKETEGSRMDALYSGKYLIASMLHKVDREQYVCILELTKDVISTTLLPALQDNPGLTQLRKM